MLKNFMKTKTLYYKYTTDRSFLCHKNRIFMIYFFPKKCKYSKVLKNF